MRAPEQDSEGPSSAGPGWSPTPSEGPGIACVHGAFGGATHQLRTDDLRFTKPSGLTLLHGESEARPPSAHPLAVARLRFLEAVVARDPHVLALGVDLANAAAAMLAETGVDTGEGAAG